MLEKDLFLPILRDGKYGFINKDKEIVIKPKFKYVSDRFRDGYCVVTYIKRIKKSIRWVFGYINKYGDLVIDFLFDKAKPFSEGMAAVCINSKWGYIDKFGELLINPVFDYACNFKEGLARFNIGLDYLTRGVSVPKGGTWGFLNKKGNTEIIPIFNSICDFEDGYAQVIQGDNNNYIDKKGHLIL